MNQLFICLANSYIYSLVTDVLTVHTQLIVVVVHTSCSGYSYRIRYNLNFGGKKVWRKGCYKGLTKKLWQMLTYIANHRLTVK